MRCLLCFLLCPILLHSSESVYLLHGFLRSSEAMEKMERALQKRGYRTCNHGYPSRDKLIAEHGADLARALRKHAQLHPGERMHFVTHSMGGVVVRAALNHPDCPVEAKRGSAVLLGPPNQGSAFGRLLCRIDPVRKLFGTAAGRELTSKESFDDIGEFPKGMRVLVISGTAGWNPFIEGENDGVVGVSECCLKTFHKHMCIPTLHTFMMLNETVIHNTLLFLEK